jgi:hypothetical protein
VSRFVGGYEARSSILNIQGALSWGSLPCKLNAKHA